MTEKIEELIAQLKAYAETRVALAKLEATKKISLVISSLVAIFMVALVFFLFMVMISIAGAWALGKWFNCMPLGFLSVGLLYLLICLFIWKGRDKFLRIPMMNSMIRKFFPEEGKKEK